MKPIEAIPFRTLGVVATLLCLVSPILAVVQQETTADRFWEKKSYQWFDTIRSGAAVRVVNRHGNVYVRFGGYESQVEVLATVQRLDPARPELVVERVVTAGDLAVTVTDPAADRPRAPGRPADRVDLVLFVPLGATLDVLTEKDLIEAKGFRGDLSLRSTSGDIRLRGIQGRVRAATDRGEISAALETGVTELPQELTTVTGDIEVHLWEDADMSVSIATSGEISTDFSLAIEHRRFEEPSKHATAVVGNGAARLDLRSKRGRVRLLRLQKYFTPQGEESEGKSGGDR